MDPTDPIVDDFSPATLTTICEANLSAYILYCAGQPAGQRYEEEALAWGSGGIDLTFLNSVVRTQFTDTHALDAAISTTVAAFQQQALAFFWCVLPSTQPADLATILRARGFSHYRDLPAMTVALDDLPAAISTPPEASIARVGNAEELHDWMEALGRTYRLSKKFRAQFGTLHEHLGVLEENNPYQLYLARMDGVPMATAALFLGAGVAGIYWVATRSEARRQGLGAAVTLAALHEARTLGYRIGTLQATVMGYPVYQRLGFSEQCRLGLYLWEP